MVGLRDEGWIWVPTMKIRVVSCVVAVACTTLASGAEEKAAPPKEPSKKEEKVDLPAQLEKEKKTLEDLRAKYLPNHPKFIAQKSKVADLEEQIAKSKPKKA